jgi:hypothetical protein
MPRKTTATAAIGHNSLHRDRVGKLGDKILTVIDPQESFHVAVEAMAGALGAFIETAPSDQRNHAEEYVKKSARPRGAAF